MRSPAFVVYFLAKSTAALATRGSSAAARGISASASTVVPVYDPPSTPQNSGEDDIVRDGYITYRLARRSDVPQIQRCNLASLPENYNSNFFVNHMRAWPELAIVAEHVPEERAVPQQQQQRAGDPQVQQQTSLLSSLVNGSGRQGDWVGSGEDFLSRGSRDTYPKKEIVGYVLGKVDTKPVEESLRVPLDPFEPEPAYPHSSVAATPDPFADWPEPQRRQQQQPQTEKLGHITSIAVMSHARRLGIASGLLKQLHFHLTECYYSDGVGLHVRVSNDAAVKLYCDRLGYNVVRVIPTYYADGEDAYFMRKEFPQSASRGNDSFLSSASVGSGIPASSLGQRMQRGLSGLLSGERSMPPWEAGPPELLLPRHARVFRPQPPPRATAASPAPPIAGEITTRSKGLRALVSEERR